MNHVYEVHLEVFRDNLRNRIPAWFLRQGCYACRIRQWLEYRLKRMLDLLRKGYILITVIVFEVYFNIEIDQRIGVFP